MKRLPAPAAASKPGAAEEQQSAAEEESGTKVVACAGAPEARQPGEEEAPEQDRQEAAPEGEAAKAERLLAGYLAAEASPITDLFLGQLQSCVTCHKCSTRFTMCAPWPAGPPCASWRALPPPPAQGPGVVPGRHQRYTMPAESPVGSWIAWEPTGRALLPWRRASPLFTS